MPKQPNIPVPEQMVVDTGDDGQIADIQGEFFALILRFLPLSAFAREKRVRSEYRTLSLAAGFGEPVDPSSVSDNQIVSLIVCDILVATVVFRRTEFNNVEASFAHYITYETLNQLRIKDPEGRWRDC